MTDAEKYVRETHPKAWSHAGTQYWPGQGERVGWMITSHPVMSDVIGFGYTEIAAWASAANRLEAKAKYKEIRPGVYESNSEPRKVDAARVSEILDMGNKNK